MPRAITIRPPDGGMLATGLSRENAGLGGYVEKLNWRREFDREVRREGHVDFGDQPPTASPINLLHYGRSPRGHVALFAATEAGEVFRFVGGVDLGVFEEGVFVEGVFESNDDAAPWILVNPLDDNGDPITMGGGHRWEAVNVAGEVVFNNGRHLPFIYRLDSYRGTFLYELRERGIAAAETIAEFGGSLLLADISEYPADFAERFANAGEVDYAEVPSGSSVSRRSYRMLFSPFGEPHRWAASVKGSMTEGSTLVTLDYPVKSLRAGDPVSVEGAGPSASARYSSGITYPAGMIVSYDGRLYQTRTTGTSQGADPVSDPALDWEDIGQETGGNLLTTVSYNDGVTAQIYVRDPAETTVTDALVQKSDVASLYPVPGFVDLQDDSSPILRMIPIRDTLVVCKGSSFITGVATGAADPFRWQVAYRGDRTLFWRWTPVAVGGDGFVFAGRRDFYYFDTVGNTPKVHEGLSLARDLFFDATVDSQMETVHAVGNGVTQEVWVCFPGSGAIKALCLDYRWGTVSTIDHFYSAGAEIKRPDASFEPGPAEDWFVMATAAEVSRYARSAVPVAGWSGARAVYTRAGENYTSRLKTGFGSFGDDFNAKRLINHVVLLAQGSTGPVTVKVFGAKNPGSTPQQLFERTLATPNTYNLIPCLFDKVYFQEELTVGGTGFISLAGLVYDFLPGTTQSISRFDDGHT